MFYNKKYFYNYLIIIVYYFFTDSQSLTDRLSSYKSPKKSKKNHAINNSKTNVECVLDNSKMPRLEKYNTNEQILTKTPRVVRKQIAKGYLIIY